MTRDRFRTRRGFIMACIGSAVGMGNIWLFPARVSEFGGGAFLIPYFIFIILISSTGVIGEMSLGRATRSGPVDAFGKICELKGRKNIGQALGVIPTIGALFLAIGYTVVVGWILKYTIGAFTGEALKGNNAEDFINNFSETAGIFGNNSLQIIALAIALVILVYGIGSGIEKVTKIIMPVFFFLFLFLAIYIYFLPGAREGYKYIFTVDFSALSKIQTWVYALGQAFFSLSVAGNGTIIYGSYLSDKEDIPHCAKTVAFFDTLAAILSAIVIIPAMATTEAQLNSGGPMLMFVFLPNLFRTMPGGRLIAIIFFTAVFFAGLSSLINLYEVPIATIEEKLKIKRRPACLIVGIPSLTVSLFIQHIVSDWMDIISIYICPLGAGLAGIMFFWLSHKDFVVSRVNTGAAKPIGKQFYFLSKYIFCPICLLVLIAGALMGGIG